jgi:hypothetical protein
MRKMGPSSRLQASSSRALLPPLHLLPSSHSGEAPAPSASESWHVGLAGGSAGHLHNMRQGGGQFKLRCGGGDLDRGFVMWICNDDLPWRSRWLELAGCGDSSGGGSSLVEAAAMAVC